MASVKKVRGSRIRGEENKEEFLIDAVEKSTTAKKIKNAKIRTKSESMTDVDASSFEQRESISSASKKIGTRKIRLEKVEDEEQVLDHEIEQEETISITVMVLILVACFVVGIVLGYMLYRLAIDSSAVILLGKRFLL